MFPGKLLYPMVGTGGFIVMFLTGLSVGHQLGLHLLSALALGFLAGCAGAALVARLERRDGGA